ncbi:MAG: GNAT family N-acetyltransferase [Propioniciclava sp.]|uniref:GNAT family N-acetyltransferase n=1 Tax=Propioniciclava sp. TaxID=2038686 RepID=UPI0039E4AF6D
MHIEDIRLADGGHVVFRPLVVPASIDDADAGDFLAFTDVRNRIAREITGHDDHAYTPAALLEYFRPDPHWHRESWSILLDGELVGRMLIAVPLENGSNNFEWTIELLPAAWRRGIGGAAYPHVEASALEHGRTVLQSWADHPESPGERLAAPTGFGSVPRSDRAARFFLRHGYTLAQVERFSRLDLTTARPRVERLHAEAVAAASGYRVVQWQLPTPSEFVEGYAWMKSRMSTDSPAGEFEWDEEIWDAARLARMEARYLGGGQTVLVTAAQHEASGRLCAFNELVIGPDHSQVTHQEDTLVLREHRGHRLGMLVKCTGLLAWMRLMPSSSHAVTFNAEENRPMLDINEAIGYVPVSYPSGWKKVLDPA